MHVATGHGVTERHKVVGSAAPFFEVRFGLSIADALTLPILSPQG
jgi:hypothetical protein